MLTFQKLPDNPDVWEEYARAGLVYEAPANDHTDNPDQVPIECWFCTDGRPWIDGEDYDRFRWESDNYHYGIIAED